MQFSAIKQVISAYTTTILNTLTFIFTTHPDYYIHRLLAIIMLLLLIDINRTNRLKNQLNDIDKRDTIVLLTIQHYSAAINRAVNEVIESNSLIATDNTKIIKHIHLAHQRVKDAYTGIFKHLDINRIRRAPKTTTHEQCKEYETETEERNAIIKEAISEMLTTELHH